MNITARPQIEATINEFKDYLMSFYGPQGIYQIDGFNEVSALRCMIYRLMNRTDMPFEGDSVDREEAIRYYKDSNNQIYAP